MPRTPVIAGVNRIGVFASVWKLAAEISENRLRFAGYRETEPNDMFVFVRFVAVWF